MKIAWESTGVGQSRKRFLRGERSLRRGRCMSIGNCRLIQLPRIEDARGNLSVIEGGMQIPFDIKRIYYLYDVPGGTARAGHGHRELQQMIVAMSGSFDITVDDGRERKTFHMNRSYYGLYIPKMMWREVDNFSSGAVCLVLASTHYDAADYLHDHDSFRDAVLQQGSQ